MDGAKIVATGPVDHIVNDILAPYGEIVIAHDSSEDSIIPLLKDAVALIVRGGGFATKRMIERAEYLRVIGRSGTGYDSVDIAAATKRKIPVVYTPGANARAVAEAALSLMLALCKNLAYWDRQLKEGNWDSRFKARLDDLDGSTLGVIGFGNIGRMLAALVAPFNMKVLAFDPYVAKGQVEQFNVAPADIGDLMRQSDFISIHAPLTDETRGLVNYERLKLMKPGSYIVNLGRGAIIESLDLLYEGLKSGILAGVGLDVFDPEPPDINHPIFKMENCLTAPHALGLSKCAMSRIYKSMAEDMAAVLGGKQPRFAVNMEVYK